MSPTASRRTRKSKPPSSRLTSSERKKYERRPALPPPPTQPKEWVIYANNMFESYNKKHPNNLLQLTSSGKIKLGGNGSTIKKSSSYNSNINKISAKTTRVNSKTKKSH